MLYDIRKRFQFHIELTDECNARCPQCSRNCIVDNVLSPRPDLAKANISFDEYKEIFKDFKYPIKNLNFCGNFGDPVYAKDIYEIIEYSCTDLLDRGNGPGKEFIYIHTNGGMRKPDWWAKFGEMLHKHLPDNHLVVFSIDGLEDTHHLYRVNTRYDRVVENARAFINAGGLAEWSFIRFGHNEHQETEARKRSKEYGFQSFIPIDTHRFWGREKLKFTFNKKPYEILRSSSKASNKKKKQATNYSADVEGARIKSKNEIECRVSSSTGRNELFIDCLGDIHPCCWIGSYEYRKKHYTNEVADPHEVTQHEIFNMRTIRNAIKEDLNHIIEDDFFQYILPMSFEVSPCNICAKQCGKTTNVRTDKVREVL